MRIEFPNQSSEEKNKKEPLSLKLYRYKRPILTGALILALIATILLQITWKRSGKTKDFFSAQSYLSNLDQGASFNEDRIKKYLSQFPELHPFFDHYLVEHFILDGKVAKADNICQNILKRVSFLDPKLLEFTKGTIQIEAGQYREAKELSEKLESALQENPSDYPKLKESVENRIRSLTKALEQL